MENYRLYSTTSLVFYEGGGGEFSLNVKPSESS